jgi:hypothetical protein
MPGMPYHLEKGPLLSVLDDFCNRGSDERLRKALGQLRDKHTLAQIGVFDSPNLYERPGPQGPERYPAPFDEKANLVKHFEHHWLGRPPQPHPMDAFQTGHWKFYQGPVEDIMRETLIRALEVALGVAHNPNDKTPGANERHWPIDFWWKCPQPWFEGWVTWRKHGNEKQQGHVTVIFATPADDGVVLRRPEAEATVVAPAVTHASEGSWLISSKAHEQTHQLTEIPTESGTVLFPTTWTIDHKAIETFSPNFGAGGAQDGGRRYVGGVA